MENILENGYSTFSQTVIKDTNLHIKAKGIYMFLCSYKNTDYIATPKRETIMNYLGIGSKDTYYKYLKQLEAQGYITVSVLKVEGKVFCNQFKINAKIGDIELFKNYGIIPRAIMNDKNISIEAKVVYGYLCMYRKEEQNNVVYPNLSQLQSQLNIGASKVSKSLNILVEQGYMDKKQYKNEQKFSSNTYHLLGYRENITVKESKLSDEELLESTQKNIEKRDLKNKTYKQVIETENRLKTEIKAYEERIKENIKYKLLQENEAKIQNVMCKSIHESEIEFFASKMNIDRDIFNFTNDTINIISRAIFSERETIKIDNVEYPKILIKEMFLKLKLEHIKEILSRYKKAIESDFIKNPSKYLETVLYSVCFDYGLVQIRNQRYGA
ncbi:MAG: helix-turn-helix domain-containing protein [Lachnospirales bacterium]